jgi:hypothetical protein
MLTFSKGINIKGNLVEAIDTMDFEKYHIINRSKNILVIHCCNNEGRMGAGFAKDLVEVFPSVFERYRSYVRSNPNILGTFFPCFVGKNVYIGNMLCMNGVYNKQGNPQPLNYEALDKCLMYARRYAEDLRADIHMPEIGTGKVRGDVYQIANLLEKHFFTYELGNVYIWNNKGGVIESF